MLNEILFSEKQRFKQWWIWFILLAVNGLFLAALYVQFIVGKPFGDKPMNDTGLLLVSAFVLLLTSSFFVLCLETRISRDGISVRFFPFHLRYKLYSWDELSECYLRSYSPIGEFGGWGIRWGNGKAYNVSGNRGLQLVFQNKKRLLIGTQKTTEIENVLLSLEKLKSPQ
jgi:hypothetical protein